VRTSSVPVQLENPGQVFAALGFLEVAAALAGFAEAGFDWNDTGHPQFMLSAHGVGNPVEAVLEFLITAEVVPVMPQGAKAKANVAVLESAAFPESVDLEDAKEVKELWNRLPIALRNVNASIEINHWCDGSSRDPLKLYSGNRSACDIALAMLRGAGDSVGLSQLWYKQRKDLLENPFGVVAPMRGRFNFDSRGGWMGIDAGYSLNDQKHVIDASPVVELLAALGLSNARPLKDGASYRYAAWKGILPPILARAALGAIDVAVPLRIFSFRLVSSGRNKIVTFAREVAI
jgi:CRISPR-associated protein Csb3